ncbi:MAG: hypothetical protein EXR92_06370 [Gemmatimonadetes bacterium]|nr:hypothetical protein [Gemmatimonadota bacterium]
MRHSTFLAPASRLLLLVAMAACAGPARAQTIPSPYRFINPRQDVGLFAGGIQEARGSLRLGPGGGPTLGARYGIYLAGPMSLEASTFLLVTDREVYDPHPNGVIELLGTTSTYVGGMDALARFALTGRRTWRGFQPFFLTGGGFVVDLAGSSDLDADLATGDQFSFGTSPLGVLGAGTRWFPSERLSLRLEAVLHLWRLSTPDSFLQLKSKLGPLEAREWAGAVGLFGGINFGF